MLIDQMPDDYRKIFQDWVKDDGERLYSQWHAMENHAITYLVTANGGGAAAVIAFAGSAGYATNLVGWTLAWFVSGIVLAGLMILKAHEDLTSILNGLSNDNISFNTRRLRSGKLVGNHRARLGRAVWGKKLGVFSFICFLVGLVFSIWTFYQFLPWKQEKDARERAEKTPAVVEVKKAECPPPPVPNSPKLETKKKGKAAG